jgi:uncharacterized CHY-type Zn-finger protein
MAHKFQTQADSYLGEAGKVFEMPRLTKEIDCGKCGRTMTVSERTVLAFCPACSQGLGVKR